MIGRASEANGRAGSVPSVGGYAFNGPEPEQRSDAIAAPVSRVGPTGCVSVDTGQQIDERDNARDQPPGRLAQAQPRSECKAAADLRKGGSDISQRSRHPAC